MNPGIRILPLRIARGFLGGADERVEISAIYCPLDGKLPDESWPAE